MSTSSLVYVKVKATLAGIETLIDSAVWLVASVASYYRSKINLVPWFFWVFLFFCFLGVPCGSRVEWQQCAADLLLPPQTPRPWFCSFFYLFITSFTFSLVPGHFPSLSSTETRFQPKPSWLPLSPFEHISTSSPSSLCKLFSVFSSSSRPSLPEITKTGNANRKTTRQPICSITNSRERLLRMKERSGSLYKHGEKKKVKMRIFIFNLESRF